MTLEKDGKPVLSEGMTLVKKLAEVMAGIERLPKTGYNEHFRYHFVQESDVLDAVRKALAERHIILVPDVKSREFYPADANRKQHKTALAITFTFIDGESGERLEFGWFGEADDGQDKGVNKAVTAALKYGLLKFFLVSTGEDPDAPEPARLPTSQPPRQSVQDGAPQRPPPTKPAPARVPPPVPPPPAQAPQAAPAAAPAATGYVDTTGTARLPNGAPAAQQPLTKPGPATPPPAPPTGALAVASVSVWSNAWDVATTEGRQMVSDFLRGRGYKDRSDFFARGADDFHETLKTLQQHDRARAGNA